MNRYFYIDAEGKQKGTFTPEDLIKENIKRETLVWTQDMEQWKRADDVPELQFIFTGAAYVAEPSATEIHQLAYNQAQTTASASAAISPMPKTWLVESILATILPFFLCGSLLSLLGIIGIVYSSQVESFYNRGDYAAAAESSRSAGRWTKIAMWIAIGWLVLMVLAVVLLFVFFGSLAGMGALMNS